MSQNYRALTRTYRPLDFDDIVSQEHVSETLKNAIKQNRLAHAYMFCGPRGVGKTTMARVLARAINNIGLEVDGESLDQTLNIFEIDAASNNSVDDVRGMRDSIRIPPQNGRYKVFIIDEVHMLSKPAFNALLKTLEEPPAHVIFIFATTEPHKVLPTILSRVQRFDFKRISADEIVSRLRAVSVKEDIAVDDESLHVLAKKADGALRDALGLMDQAIAFCGTDIKYEDLLLALNVVGHERLFSIMELIHQKKVDECLLQVHNLLQDGFDIQEFLVGMNEHLRNLYMAISGAGLQLIEASADTKNRYHAQAALFCREDILRMMHIVSETQIRIKEVQQPRIHFEMMFIKLLHMSKASELQQLFAELEDLKKNSVNRISPEKLPPTNGLAAASEKIPSHPEQKTEAPAPDLTPARATENAEPYIPSKRNLPHPKVVEKRSFKTVLSRPALQEDSVVAEETIAESPKKASANHAVVDSFLPQSLREFEESWNAFLQSEETSLDAVLIRQLRRVLLVKLEKEIVWLQAEDPFCLQMLEVNRAEIEKELKLKTGCAVKFQFQLRPKSDTNGSTRLNPYEEFKLLQEKEPILRDIVELFGAEIEY